MQCGEVRLHRILNLVIAGHGGKVPTGFRQWSYAGVLLDEARAAQANTLAKLVAMFTVGERVERLNMVDGIGWGVGFVTSVEPTADYPIKVTAKKLEPDAHFDPKAHHKGFGWSMVQKLDHSHVWSKVRVPMLQLRLQPASGSPLRVKHA
eukprot:SAG11_NODE_14811_length_599_cov_0.594000_2_plen_149_part_01